ncbi:Hsp70 family protein [Rhodococcus sp. NPDC058532]|uniref:Hsp70 family protein n=1 Tax=Rhodococcus sp. NPDC058532 TaxID=3346540 RepID=UPI003657AD67
MSAVLGVSVGASAVRMATRTDHYHSADQPGAFEQQAVDVVTGPVEDVAAQSIGVLLEHEWHGDIGATGIVYGSGVDADAIHAAMARQHLWNYQLVPEAAAVVTLLESVGQLGPDTHTLVLYDLGSTGVTISVVDRYTRSVITSERSDVVGGDQFDALIAEQQVRERGHERPVDTWAAAELTARCRTAKEQLSTIGAVCLPGDRGLILLNRERFDALIRVPVEGSARLAREVIAASGRRPDVLVFLGGGARIPLVQSVLQGWLALPIVQPPEPEMVAAQGAALLAAPVEATPEPALPEPNWSDTATTPVRRLPGGATRKQLALAGSAASGLLVIAAIGLALDRGDDTTSQREPAVSEVIVEQTTPTTTPPRTTTTTTTPTPTPAAPVVTADREPSTTAEPTPPPPPGPRYLNLPAPIQIEVPPGLQLPPGMVR